MSSNTKRYNEDTIFTSEKLDKLDELEKSVKNLTTNNSEYYESNTVTASVAQGDLTHNKETITHTSNGNKTVTRTGNGIFKHKLLSNRNIPVLPPELNPSIDKSIALILLASQRLLAPVMKEGVADAVSGSAWVNMTPRQLIQTGVERSTPGNIRNAVNVVEPPSPVLIGIVSTYPPCGLNKRAIRLQINGNPLPPDWSDKPKTWTLLLMESCLMISILRPVLAGQSITNSPMVPVVTSARAVG